MTHRRALALLPETFAICRLDPDAPVPPWADSKHFCSITRTQNELSIVCPQENVPAEVQCEKHFRSFRIEGKVDFSETGILASLAAPLAEAGISIFTISTFDTDYLLVKQENLDKAIQSLQQAGHEIQL